MDTQTLTPDSNGPFSSNTSVSGRRSPILIVLIILLTLGTIGFGSLTVMFAGRAATATKTAKAQAQTAAAAAIDQQKKADNLTYTQASESPFRAYVAPDQFGSFRISFPKNWSSTVDEESSGTQVSLVLNPDFISRSNSTDAPVAARVQLIERSKDQFLASFAGQIKAKKQTQTAITVSGQPGYDLNGQFADHKTVREVVVPVRDKVIVFSTEDSRYSTEFNEILSQATIIP